MRWVYADWRIFYEETVTEVSLEWSFENTFASILSPRYKLIVFSAYVAEDQ